MPVSPSSPPHSSHGLAAFGVVGALAILLLVPQLGAPLLIDERVLAFESIKWLSLDPAAPWTLPLGGSGTWRPLLVYVHRLDAEAAPWVRHLVSAAGYLLLSLLVLRWLRGRFGASSARFGAAWFAVHGAHVAVGGWVGGRSDLSMGIAAVLAITAYDRGRVLVAAGWVTVAILCKETAVVLPVVLWLLDGRRVHRGLGAVTVATLGAFGASWLMQEVDAGYLPTPGSWATAVRYLPLFALEAMVPLFRPIAVLRPLDALGAIVAAAVAVGLLRRRPSPVWPIAAGVAFLPVVHVLPNDGGQWYLLLPTILLAAAWADLHADGLPKGARCLPLVFLVVGVVWSGQWAAAAREVDARVEAAGAVPVEQREHPEEDPLQWPHAGPSLCCGYPYQLYADPRGETLSPPRPEEARPSSAP